MKFFNEIRKEEEEEQQQQDENNENSMRELIHSSKLGKWEKVLIHAVAMQDNNNISSEKGKLYLKQYIKSVGRFGKTPFLYPLYGVSELCQAFCRRSAVSGIYKYKYKKKKKWKEKKKKKKKKKKRFSVYIEEVN